MRLVHVVQTGNKNLMNVASKSLSKYTALVGSAFGLLIVLGCGDDTGLEKRYPVYGTVTYQGKPIEHGTINFTPAKPDVGRAAGAPIEQGAYKLTTATEGDGALPGAYNVTVTAFEISDNAELKAIAKGGQFHHDKTFAKATASAKNLIPQKYASLTTSDLKADIKPQSNKLDFDLKD